MYICNVQSAQRPCRFSSVTPKSLLSPATKKNECQKAMQQRAQQVMIPRLDHLWSSQNALQTLLSVVAMLPQYAWQLLECQLYQMCRQAMRVLRPNAVRDVLDQLALFHPHETDDHLADQTEDCLLQGARSEQQPWHQEFLPIL